MTKKSFIGFQVLNEDGYPATSGTLEDDRESAIFTNIDGAQRWIRWLKEEVGSTDNFTVRRVEVKVLEENVNVQGLGEFRCPECGDGRISAGRDIKSFTDGARQHLVCIECGAEWNCLYKFVGFDNLTISGETPGEKD